MRKIFYRDFKITTVSIEVNFISPVGEEYENVKLFITDDYSETRIIFTEEFANETKEKLLNLLQKKIKTYSKIFKQSKRS